MITVRISGGLGNQLFQYALGRALSLINDCGLYLDVDTYDRRTGILRPYRLEAFDIKATRIKIGWISRAKRRFNRFLERSLPLSQKSIIIEPGYTFYPQILEAKDDTYLSGVWQSEKYFKSIDSHIRKDIVFINEPSDAFKRWAARISDSNSVFIHIRRGDYVTDQRTNALHGIIGENYYQKAIELMEKEIPDARFFVFSDDITWAKSAIKAQSPLEFVSDGSMPEYEELMLMARAKHAIIANSTFSWWGAWLIPESTKKVIAPREWFKARHIDTRDLLPEGWRTL